jgi:GNAT superfamily N-acetyltransferase
MLAYSDPQDIDFPALARLTETGWRHDYRGQVRICYDEPYLRWLLGGTDWAGVIVHDTASRPIACVFSLFRTLRFAAESAAAAYSCQLVVAPDHRSSGVGLWLTDRSRKLLAERHSRDAFVGIAHEGKAIQQMSQSRRAPKGPQPISIATQIWSKRLRSADTSLRIARDSIWKSIRYLEKDELEPLARLIIASPYPIFDVAESFGRLYLRSQPDRSRTLWFTSDTGIECAISFSMHSLALDDAALGNVGQIQCVLERGCDARALGDALRRVMVALLDAGCFAACSLDHGGISRQLLMQLGFVRSGDCLTLRVGGSGPLLDRLRQAAPPFIMDFL